MRKSLAILGCIAGIHGCGTVVRGTSEMVTVKAEPADAAIRTSLGHSCPTSPCTVDVKRKAAFTAYAEKEGFKPGSIYIGTEVSGKGGAAVVGNALIGGVIGVGVDVATGAALDHTPNPATIVLQPMDSALESTKAVVPPPPSPEKGSTPVS